MISIQEIVRSLSATKWLMILAAVLVIALLGTCTVNKVTDMVTHNKQVRDQNRDIAARDKSDAQRVKDLQEIRTNTEKLNEIVESVPPTVPSAQRYALACARMRADSRVRELPARCRSEENGSPAL
jgi:capsular polysaccharide biosynthesis protein